MTRDPLNIGVRLTPELHAALSAEVSRRTSVDPDAGWTLSSVARSILRASLLGRATPATATTHAHGAQVQSPVEAPESRTTATATVRAEVDTAAVQSSPAVVPQTVEALCGACGEGLWHGCTRGCGRRTRTCVCAESVAADGVCASCAPRPVDLALTPPKPRTVKGIAPDDAQESARAEVRAWLARDATRLARDLAPVAGTADQNLRRWLNPNRLQRLPVEVLDRVLAHVKANP